MKNLTILASVCSIYALILAGCTFPGAVTGGGWIPSADGVAGDKANFGFSAQQCDLSQPPTGNFNFHDKSAKFSAPGSVKFNGSIAAAGQCTDPPVQPCSVDSDCTEFPGGTCAPVDIFGNFCSYSSITFTVGCAICFDQFHGLLPPKSYGFDVNYTSTNSTYPGTGTASVCVVDNGQGSKASSKDFAIVDVTSGPYKGYVNQGNVQGNIAGQTCP